MNHLKHKRQIDNINIWDIPFQGCAQEVWNKKSKEEKIRVWETQYVIDEDYYTRENTNILANFIKALGDSEDRELYNLVPFVVEYINNTHPKKKFF